LKGGGVSARHLGTTREARIWMHLSAQPYLRLPVRRQPAGFHTAAQVKKRAIRVCTKGRQPG
jgi:hypothetical protein